ncbi:hypothetical protein [Actinoplanes regularis]|uniref:hypothetical protein n=1 Tax=Actinoplanes regularis TaxID=52697 RepID=UPI0025553C0F|nr:hypothetical protein [Actinoplanes regularis]GLW28057.1 hypothetical protein Areg01_09970 [Actinoplanes regularis]
MAMNSVSGNSASVASLATSVFGDARQAFKAMADAATNAQSDAERAGSGPVAGKNARRGTVLDRYL